MQCSGLCEPEHAVHGYLMCDVRWHALQRQHMSGKGSNLVTPRALFFALQLTGRRGLASYTPVVQLCGHLQEYY